MSENNAGQEVKQAEAVADNKSDTLAPDVALTVLLPEQHSTTAENTALESKKKFYRTRGKIKETISSLPDHIILPTLPAWENGISFYESGNAFIAKINPVKTDKLKYENGFFYYGDECIDDKQKMEALRTNVGLNDIDLPLARYFFSCGVERFEKTLKAREALGVHIDGDDITELIREDDRKAHTFYVPELIEKISGDRNPDKQYISVFLDRVRKLHNIFGIARGVDNPQYATYAPVVILKRYNAETNVIEVEMPYFNTLIRNIYKAAWRLNGRGTLKKKANGAPALKARYSFLLNAELTNRKNKNAVENVAIIVTLIEQAGDNVPHICAKTLVERNPALLEQVKKSKRPNLVLARVFKNTWEYLKEDTSLEKKYPGIKLPDPCDRGNYPTLQNWGNLIFKFPHPTEDDEKEDNTTQKRNVSPKKK